MPEKMPDRMPDRMLEEFVRMGITRSKVVQFPMISIDIRIKKNSLYTRCTPSTSHVYTCFQLSTLAWARPHDGTSHGVLPIICDMTWCSIPLLLVVTHFFFSHKTSPYSCGTIPIYNIYSCMASLWLEKSKTWKERTSYDCPQSSHIFSYLDMWMSHFPSISIHCHIFLGFSQAWLAGRPAAASATDLGCCRDRRQGKSHPTWFLRPFRGLGEVLKLLFAKKKHGKLGGVVSPKLALGMGKNDDKPW